MALFKRATLKDQGFSDEQIDYIMSESGKALYSNYVSADEVQAKIDAAVKAVKPEPVDVKGTPEYAELARERDMLRAIGGEDFATVKPKFRETVFGMLDRGEKAKPIAEQLTGVREKFEEYFVPEKKPDEQKPAFGSPDKGKMPTGEQGDAAKIADIWGFAPKK